MCLLTSTNPPYYDSNDSGRFGNKLIRTVAGNVGAIRRTHIYITYLHLYGFQCVSLYLFKQLFGLYDTINTQNIQEH